MVSKRSLRILYVEDDDRPHALVLGLVNDASFVWSCASNDVVRGRHARVIAR